MEEMYIGHLATANYDFYIVAADEETMFLELEKAWNNHRDRTHATWTWEEVRDDVWWNKQYINLVWKRG
jgi:hypothetical protein